MLTTTRQGARLAPRLAAAAVPASAAFAESSKQAELRAARPALVLGHGSGSGARRKLSAVAFAPASQPRGDDVSHSHSALPARPAARPSPSSPSVEPASSELVVSRQPRSVGARPRNELGTGPPPYDGDQLTPVERFRRRVDHDPLGALLWLRELKPPALYTITTKDLKRMIFNITEHIKPSPQLRAAVDHSQATEALHIVRALLFAEPSKAHLHANNPNADKYIGANLKGGTLRGLFRLGILLGSQEFVAELFAERMSDQIRTGRRIVNTEWLALDLAAGREWQLAADLFPGPESAHPTDKYVPQIGSLPAEAYTPRLISIVMTANLVVQQPWRAVKLFGLLKPRQASSQSHCALIQAHLQLGDVAAAKQAVHRAHKAGIDSDAIQLAMLRGHRMLGLEDGLGERLREDLTRLGLAPRIKLVNALGWLCLDAGDVDGADQLLVELQELESSGQINGDDSDLAQTALIALAVASRRNDVERTKKAWSFFTTRPEAVTDNVVAHLCRALIRLGRVQDTARILKAAVLHDPASSPWPIPASFVPAILTGNTVLEAACTSQSYEALIEVLALMRAGGIEPDKRSVILTLTFAKTTLLSSPASLTKLLEAILERTRDTPTVDQINVILAEVVRIATRDPKYRDRYLAPKSGTASTEDPGAGIETRGALRHLLAKQIAILHDSGQTSTGTSLSNRLLYDALALDGVWPIHAVQKTWQSFVLRGFRPTSHHYLTLIMAYTRIGAMKEAEETIELAARGDGRDGRGVSPEVTREMYTALLTGWANVGNLEAARRAYSRIRSLPCGTDATALDAIVNAHVMADQPGWAIALARQDIAAVEPNERLVVSVAHAIRRNNDTPGAIFFVSHFTVRRGGVDGTDNGSATKGKAKGRKAGKEVQTAQTQVSTGADTAFADSPSPTPPPNAHWQLTPKLLSVVRKALNYLAKMPASALDERTREATLLAHRMLADDDVSRPFRTRSKRRLGVRTAGRLVEAVDIARSDRVVEAGLRDARRLMALERGDAGKGKRGKGGRRGELGEGRKAKESKEKPKEEASEGDRGDRGDQSP